MREWRKKTGFSISPSAWNLLPFSACRQKHICQIWSGKMSQSDANQDVQTLLVKTNLVTTWNGHQNANPFDLHIIQFLLACERTNLFLHLFNELGWVKSQLILQGHFGDQPAFPRSKETLKRVAFFQCTEMEKRKGLTDNGERTKGGEKNSLGCYEWDSSPAPPMHPTGQISKKITIC